MTEQEARDIYHQGEEVVVSKFMEFDARLKITPQNYTPMIDSPLFITFVKRCQSFSLMKDSLFVSL